MYRYFIKSLFCMYSCGTLNILQCKFDRKTDFSATKLSKLLSRNKRFGQKLKCVIDTLSMYLQKCKQV